ncbi:hypothetical protein [Maricaulis sp.]|uniref:hypothetical protein n=1 Tax=Maricaulis sp. TaxID=1486257 RepID=UPI00261C4DF6|nr:hypothetical protein [Maricaulis sp.]
MRVPFALWSGVVAAVVLAGLMARDYMNFGVFELNLPLIGMVVGGWIGVVLLVGFISQIRNAAKSRPVDVPNDVASEIRRHPQD